MTLFLALVLFALWLICADVTADVLADLGCQPRSASTFLWCLVFWFVLAPLLLYVLWSDE